jgi:hypothetical protein
VRRGLEDFQQKLLEGGNSLKRLGDELLEYLQQSLDDQHNERRHDLEQLRASVAAESSRLRQDVQSLDMRMAKLDESARSLETGLDTRLGQMAGNTVKQTRDQLESITNAGLEELKARILKLIEDQLAEASGKIANAQASTMDSVSESLQQQATGALQTFDHSIDEMAKLSVERWRLRLATTLTALAKNLGEQFEREA